MMNAFQVKLRKQHSAVGYLPSWNIYEPFLPVLETQFPLAFRSVYKR